MRINLIFRYRLYAALFVISSVLFVLDNQLPIGLCLAMLMSCILLFEGTQIFLKTQFLGTWQFVFSVYFIGLGIRLFFALGITYYFDISYNNLLGHDPQDELGYYRNSLEIAGGRWSHLKFDSDFGASFYYGVLAWIVDGNIYLMKSLNAVFASFIPVQTYFLAIKLSDHKVAKGAAFISVFFPLYLIHVGFLFKESIMLVILLLALNSLFKIKGKTWVFSSIILFITIVVTFFFRTITGISLLIGFYLWFYLRRRDLRLIMAVIGVIISYWLLSFSLFGLEILHYTSLMSVENLGGYLGFLLQSDGIILTPTVYLQFLVLSIIGPLPTLLDSPSDYISLLAPYRYLKVMMSPLIYYGLFLLVKDKRLNLIVLVYVIVNFVGIWFAGFFLIDIFQFIFYPIFIVAFMRAMTEINVASMKYLVYLFFSLFIIIYWNAYL